MTLQLHLHSDDLSGLTDADPISTWTDRSVNAFSFTAAGTARPTYRATGTHGLNDIRTAEFDGSNDALDGGDILNMNGASELTVVALVHPDRDLSASGSIIARDASGNRGYRLAVDGSSGLVFFQVATGATTVCQRTVATTMAKYYPMVIRARYDGGAGELSIWINGVKDDGTLTTSVPATIGNGGPTNLRVGSDGFNQDFNGHIADVRLYDTALSDAAAEVVEQELVTRAALYVLQQTSFSGDLNSHQGIAVTPDNYITIHTSDIQKRSKTDYSLVAQNSSPFTGLSGGQNHITDGAYYNGFVYVEIEDQPDTGSDHYLARFDVSDLSRDAEQDIGAPLTSSGIAIDAAAGIIYGCDHSGGSGIVLQKWNLSDFSYIGSVTTDFPSISTEIQGISLNPDDGLLWGSFGNNANTNGLIVTFDPSDGTHRPIYRRYLPSSIAEGIDVTQSGVMHWLLDHGTDERDHVYAIGSPLGPDKPSISVDPDSFSAQLTGSAYSHSSSLGIKAAHWQVATDLAFSSVTYEDTDTYPPGEGPSQPDHLAIDLSASTSYYARVRYQDEDDNWSAWSSAEPFTTDSGTAPTTPTLSADQSYDQVTLTSSAFADPEDPDRDHVMSEWQVDESGGDYSTPVAESLEDLFNLTSITLSGLTASTAYIARVRHRASDGSWSAWSSNESFTTDAAPASPPDTPTASIESKTSASLTIGGTAFNYPGEPYLHAETLVQVSTSNTFPVASTFQESFVPGQVTGLLVDNLQANTLYYYRIRYLANNGIWSAWSTTKNETTSATALGSSILRLTAPRHGAVVRGSSVTVSWLPVSAGGVTFEIERTSDWSTWTSVATGLSTSPYSWDVSGLTDGVYAIRIRATDGSNPTEWEYRTVVVDNASDPFIFTANVEDGMPSADFTPLWNTAGHTWTLNETSITNVGSRLSSPGWAALAYGPAFEPNQADILCETLNASTGGSFPWSWFPEQCWAGCGMLAAGSGSDVSDGILAAFYALPIWPYGSCYSAGRGDGFLNVEAYEGGIRVLSAQISLGKIHFTKLWDGCSKIPRYGVRLRVTTIAELPNNRRRLRIQAAVTGMDIDTEDVGQWHYEGSFETDLNCGQACLVSREITTSKAYRSFTSLTVLPYSYEGCSAPPAFEEPAALETCALPVYDLTIFDTDDTTPLVGTGTPTAITEASYSTDPDHPRSWLKVWSVGPRHEVDPIQGSSSVGSISATVVDKRLTVCDQRSGQVTTLLGDSDGYSQWIGHRAIWREKLPDGTFVHIQDGPIRNVRLAPSMAGIETTGYGARERERNVPLFTKNETVSAWPPGPIDGYGFIGNVFFGSLGLYLINPAEIGTGTFQGGGGFGSVTVPGYSSTDYTEAMLALGAPALNPDSLFDWQIYYPNITVRWRNNSNEEWRYVRSMIGPPPLLIQNPNFWIANYSYDVLRGTVTVQPGPFRFYLNVGVTAEEPTNGSTIQFQVLSQTTSEDWPFYYEGNAGTFLKNAYDGVYSTRDPNVNYDSDGMDAFIARAPNIRFRKTQVEDDMRQWVEKNIYAPLSEVPGLTDDATIIPVSTKLPQGTDALTVLDNALVLQATWDHDGGQAIPIVRFRYVRESRGVISEDPLTYGVVEQEVWIERQARSSSLITTKGLEFKPETIRSIGGTLGEALTGGNPLSEFAGRLAYDRANEIAVRYAFGPELVSLRARPTAAVRALTVGTWCLIDLDWIPNLRTRYRGGQMLCLVLGRQKDRGLAYDLTLLVAGLGAAGLTGPALGSPTVNADLTVTLTIASEWFGWSSGFSSGFGDPLVTVRVEYALSDTEPAAGSGLWTLLANVTSPRDVTTEPLPAGSTVWFRARAEREDYRPGPWSTAVSASVGATTPVLYTLRVTIAPDGTPTIIWSSSPPTLGLYIEYGILGAGAEPLYGTVVEVEATAENVSGWSSGWSSGFTNLGGVERQYILSGVTVDEGEQISVRATPYTGWSAGSDDIEMAVGGFAVGESLITASDGGGVTGTAGQARTAQATNETALVTSGWSAGFSTGWS